MFLAAAKLFLSFGLGPITKQIELWQERRAKAEAAQNDRELRRIDAKLKRLELIAQLQEHDERRNKRFRTWMRAMIAGIPTAILVWKVLVYDMALQQCGGVDALACTPPPGAFVMIIVNASLAWYFLFEGRD